MSDKRRVNPARARTESDEVDGVRRPIPVAGFESWLDAQIRRAEAGGYFDDLPGQVKPLPKGDDFESLGDSWLAHHVLKEAGYLPNWLEIRKEVAAERARVVAALGAYRAESASPAVGTIDREMTLAPLRERYVELARAINRKIDEHNLRRPSGVPELTRFPEDATERPRVRGRQS